MKLKGHTDNIRALVLNRDGTQVKKRIHIICEKKNSVWYFSAFQQALIIQFAYGHWVNKDVSANFIYIQMLFGHYVYVNEKDISRDWSVLL